jgi:hypothetical protein
MFYYLFYYIFSNTAARAPQVASAGGLHVLKLGIVGILGGVRFTVAATECRLLKEADVIVFYLLENYCQINLIFGI